MTQPPTAVVRWVVVVAVAGAAALLLGVSRLPNEPVTWQIALALGVGVVAAILTPIRYRVAGSVHGVTVEVALVAAMLLSLPAGVTPIVHTLGVTLAHGLRRTPPVRLVFNAGLVAVSATLSATVFDLIGGEPGEITFITLAGVLAAVVTYEVVSAGSVAELFRRLGAGTFVGALRDVLPVSRVTVPFNVVAGIGLGWLATQGVPATLAGVGAMVVLFVAYRAFVGVRQQRDRASRLRDVAMTLVSASGSLEAFDEALQHVAVLFGAVTCELLLVEGRHRVLDASTGVVEREPSAAARAGMQFERATTLPPGTVEGGPEGALVSPLIRDRQTIGTLTLHARRGLEPWDDADEDVLDGVTGEVVVALQNAQLAEEIAAERSRLAEQTELLGGVLQAASDGIALIGATGGVLAWNPAMSGIAGTADANVIGRLWTDVLRATDDQGGSEGPLAAVEAALGGATMARTWRIRPPVGEERWVRAVLSPASAGSMDAVVVVAHDVTAAREVDRLKADFIATVSHELRTPLTPIKGFIELDGRGALDPERRAEMLGLMRRQVERLEDLIEDLLSMARLDRDLVDVAAEPVELREVLTRIHMQHVTTGRVMPHSEPVTVVGDLEAIVNIVDALVDNALKHTEGAVQVTVGRRDDVGTITVRDHGPGIAAADQEVIFERFSRLGDHLLRTQGPGLGLPIARALARRLGGDVTVESARGEGATFEVWLPLA